MTDIPTEIPKHWVEETWQEIGSPQNEIKAVSLSRSFTKKQPALVDFILTFSQDFSKDASELSYYIALVVWRCYERFFDRKLREIQPEEVIEQYKKNGKMAGFT